MRFKRNKGFTMVELVVVVAAIAVLAAIVMPFLTTREDNKLRVTNGAKDFYVAAQHIFSKFAKYELDMTGQDVSSTDGAYVVCYDKEFGGNRPIAKYIFFYAKYENGKIIDIDAYSSDDPELAMAQVLSRQNRSDASKNHAFLSKLLPELQAVFEASDGSYYALIEYDKSLKMRDTNLTQEDTTASAGNNLMKVVMAGYGDYELPRYADTVTDTVVTGFESYKQTNLLVTDLGLISSGDYFGIQSSQQVGSDYIGDYGTYFAPV